MKYKIRLYCILIFFITLTICICGQTYQEKVNQIFELNSKYLEPPKHYYDEDYEHRTNDFNANKYFEILTHLNIDTSYTLDYFWFHDESGGVPILYYRKPEEISYNTVDELINKFEIDTPKVVWETPDKFLNKIKIDGSNQGFFEFILLKTMYSQFYLSWHAFYRDTMLVCDSSGLNNVYEDVSRFDLETARFSESTKLDFRPIVLRTQENVIVSVVIFTKWGGFWRLTHKISYAYPHKVILIDEEPLDAFTYLMSF